MASLAEQSVASVSITQLQQYRDQLMHRAGGGTEVDRDTTSNDPALHDAVGPDGAESEPAGKLSQRPQSSRSAARPGVMEAASQTMPKFGAKAASFSGRDFGDTQPMESQVYREVSESMFGLGAASAVVDGASLDAVLHTYDTTAMEETPRTLREGDAGYVNLAAAFHPSSQGRSSVADFDDFLQETSPQTQFQAPERVVPPETPALAGHKHGRHGEILASTGSNRPKTPGYSQFFALPQGAPLFTATQLFDQTQAISSPLRGAPHSDPIVTRPSPNVHQAATSPPPVVYSSPTATVCVRASTAGADPRENYKSVKESQERRAARMREELGIPNDVVEEDEEEDLLGMGTLQTSARRLRRTMSARPVSGRPVGGEVVGAPSSHRKLPTVVDLRTPAAPKHGETAQFDDETSSMGSAVEELEEDCEAGHDGHVDSEDERSEPSEGADNGANDDNDEYDELGQDVRRSQSNAQAMPTAEDFEAEMGEDEDAADAAGAASHGFPAAGHDLVLQTQNSAIADSQPAMQSQALSQTQRQQSSLASFIPGSQYVGKTSEEQALIRTIQRPILTDRVPSSPPIPPPLQAPSIQHAEISSGSQRLSERDRAARAQQRLASAMQEIPESEQTNQERTSGDYLAAGSARNRHATDSELPYSTARTHASSSGPSTKISSTGSLKRESASQLSVTSNFSPRKAAGVRPFAESTLGFAHTNSFDETRLDIASVMDPVMDPDDQQILAAISDSPKRTRARNNADQSLPHWSSSGPDPKSRTAVPDSESAGAANTTSNAVNEYVGDERPDESSPPRARFKRRRVAQRLPPSTPGDPLEEEDTEDNAAIHEPPTASRGTPLVSDSKAKEQPMFTPTKAKQNEAITPDSVLQREQAGAMAVSDLLSSRSGKLRKPSKSKRVVMYGRASSAKKKQGSNGRIPSAHQRGDDIASAAAEPLPSEKITAVPAHEAAVEPADADATTTEVLGLAASQREAVSRRRIFALFKGSYNNFYAATWISTSPDGLMHQVRFDDGTVTSLDAKQACSLEFRLGDQIKVDLPRMRNKTWLVCDLVPPASESDLPVGDIYGNAQLRVRTKASRNSTTNATDPAAKDGDVFVVPVSAVYLTHSLWPPFQSRLFHPPAPDNAARADTPSAGAQTPSVHTPSSRTARARVPTAKAAADKRVSHLRGDHLASPISTRNEGIFRGMAFAISYVSKTTSGGQEKERVVDLIAQNGGTILEAGFEELFDLPSFNEPAAIKLASSQASNDNRDQNQGLALRSECQGLCFAAVITDCHNRRAKYIQALALDLPTLSGRWVLDSVDPMKNPTLHSDEPRPLPWTRYLLPAGESVYLGGAVRSRTLAPYDVHPRSCVLADILSQRPAMLRGEGVLMVASKRGAGWEKRKTYMFLTLALGAGTVKRVADVQEAKTLIATEPGAWKWVYVDGPIAGATDVLFKSAGSKKGKRGPEATFMEGRTLSATDGSVMLVNDEFVVQSLILGALVE